MTKSLEQKIKYHEKEANNPNYVKVYDNLGNWIQAHRCADLLNKQSEQIIALQNENAELGLKVCSLELIKGHLSQCESALESRDKRIAELEKALRWSRDENTGFEPSISVMHRYYDELIPIKRGAE